MAYLMRLKRAQNEIAISEIACECRVAVSYSRERRARMQPMHEKDEEKRISRRSPPPFTLSMRSIRQCSWYWGNMSWLEAEKVLMSCPLGTYLIRDSASDRYIFTISYRTTDSVHHTRLPQHGGKFCLGGPNSLVRSDSLMAFVDTLQQCGERGVCLLMHQKGDRAATQTMALNRALHRHQLLPPLKYLCRVVIRHSFTPYSLSKLPLPPKMLRYVQDPKYLVPPC